MKLHSARKNERASWGRNAVLLVVLAAAVVLALASASTSSASSRVEAAAAKAKPKPKPVKPDLAFYKGKTITYILTDNPGATDDTVSQAIIPKMEQFLHATINIQYVPTAGGSEGENQVAAAKPDGLTLAMYSALDPVYAVYKNQVLIDFDLTKAGYVGATHQPPGIVVGCGGSKLNSWTAILNSQNPVKVVVVATGAAIVLDKVILNAWNVPRTIVTGYNSTSTMIPGCARGDGDMSYGAPLQWSDASGSKVSPQYLPLIEMGKQPAGSNFAYLNTQIPTLADYYASHKPKTALGQKLVQILLKQYASTAPKYAIMTTPGVPARRLEALREAFNYAMKQPDVTATLLKFGIPPGPFPGVALLPWMKEQLKYASTFASVVQQP
jgi:tripartite-type tricarboxylate transporter receptor subunit TctC